ncbi:type 1 glutamine amidotransferase [Amycolatopsis sp. WGS_07]|uniref:type 1 glutamine amidotransferase n=1 Tax=Amycolatopsis sp. WGS_07 TaxID=3076764 RepID=UPI0038730837
MTDKETVLVLRHQEDAGPGNLATWLDARRIPWRLVDVADGLPAPRPCRALVVLGSRESVYDPAVPWVPDERAFVREQLALGTPVFGICFGAQLLAEVLGGEVRPAEAPERGWAEVKTSAGGALTDAIEGRWFEWHGDEIAAPPGAAVLSADRCVQAFVHGPHLGVQFHPEITADQIRAWMANDRRRRQLREAGGEPEDLLLATEACDARAGEAAAGLYDAFFGMVRPSGQ